MLLIKQKTGFRWGETASWFLKKLGIWFLENKEKTDSFGDLPISKSCLLKNGGGPNNLMPPIPNHGSQVK
jgi:hypothetical protein